MKLFFLFNLNTVIYFFFIVNILLILLILNLLKKANNLIFPKLYKKIALEFIGK